MKTNPAIEKLVLHWGEMGARWTISSMVAQIYAFRAEEYTYQQHCLGAKTFSVFAVFGDGAYRLQPIHVDDLADLAVTEGMRTENAVINAIGPETFAYRDLVQAVGTAIGRPRPLINVSPKMGYFFGRVLSVLMRDTFITHEEIRGLMDELLYVTTPPTGKTSLTTWMQKNAATLGLRYASELDRRRDRQTPYLRK
jgi:hypothetical protein